MQWTKPERGCSRTMRLVDILCCWTHFSNFRKSLSVLSIQGIYDDASRDVVANQLDLGQQQQQQGNHSPCRGIKDRSLLICQTTTILLFPFSIHIFQVACWNSRCGKLNPTLVILKLRPIFTFFANSIDFKGYSNAAAVAHMWKTISAITGQRKSGCCNHAQGQHEWDSLSAVLTPL